MSDYGIGNVIKWMLILLAISLPLGIWKLVEIILWLCQHVRWK